MTTDTRLPGSLHLWRVASLVTLGGGAIMVATGRGSLSAGILLLVGGLAASGVLLGAGDYGPGSEGVLDLSSRLGSGLLGGAVGGLVVVLARWAISALGVDGALGVALPSVWTSVAFLPHMGGAAVWGMVLGIVYPHVPGTVASQRGVRFSLIVSLYMLLKVYPFDLDAGWFGSGYGALAFLFVIVLNVLWGSVAGAAIGWAEEDDEAPVSRPIDS